MASYLTVRDRESDHPSSCAKGAKVPTELENAQKSLTQIQNFDVTKLAREDDLGKSLSFLVAIAPAARLVNLFQRVPAASLEDFPAATLSQLKQWTDQVLTLFDEILAFKLESDPNPTQRRKQLIDRVNDLYNQSWPIVFPFVSYGAARATDFRLLERQGQQAVESINSASANLTNQLKADAEESKKLLESIRNVAAEQGVSQQAEYFKKEADRHEKEAASWRQGTVLLAVGLVAFAVLTMFTNHIPWLSPKDNLESTQIITGKVLIFVVIAYMLLLSARNFMAHVHNTIVNRHRQNALLTFNVMTGAGSEPATRDIVLAQAAACIYAPQETGYTKSAPQETSLPQALLGLVARTESK
jgi:hypothetical protein